MRSTRDHECQTVNCNQRAWSWVTKKDDDYDRNKHVCNDCRDFLTSQENWKRLDW